jgi:hypothetical protein
MMGFAANAFHWTPAAFSAATPHEYFAAYEVWLEMNPPPEDEVGK